MTTLSLSLEHTRWRDFLKLTKPRVVTLMVFTAMIGMLLASQGTPDPALFLLASLGITLAAGGAAALNCLAERDIDAIMKRTIGRPLPKGKVSPGETLVFALILGGAGLAILYLWVNPLTAGLTAATFFGYAVVYTRWLKPTTPQNIVIGGASGAMPPALGWAAMSGHLGYEALLLVLIIFAWTPPHFWSLALYRKEEYAQTKLPMLPVTHGDRYTRLSVLLYTILLAGVTLLLPASGMTGWLYLLACLPLNGYYLILVRRLFVEGSSQLARQAFSWSIIYLCLLFSALLIDHYFLFPI